jgi:hypothetical protein
MKEFNVPLSGFEPTAVKVKVMARADIEVKV